MTWWVVHLAVAVQLSSSGAGTTMWNINWPGGMTLSGTALSENVGSVINLASGFDIHILSVSSNGVLVTELHVTAARELNNVRVECRGTMTYSSTIQIASVAALTGVMTTVDEGQFTPSTASATLTWSASSEADNYTIIVTPPLPSGDSLLSTNTTSLQLAVYYNEEYTVNITSQNCAGINSTTSVIFVVGCSPPSPPVHGRISEHSSGVVGAMLTFQCDAGYLPQHEVTSTCLYSGGWVPIPHCEVSRCGPPTAPVNGHINSNYSSTVEGSQITFHCSSETDYLVVTSTCTNRSWIPDPADFYCVPTQGSENIHIMLSAGSQVAITAVICSLVFFIFGLILGVIYHHLPRARCTTCKFERSSENCRTPPVAVAPVVYEEVSPDRHSQVKCDIELKENVAYGNV